MLQVIPAPSTAAPAAMPVSTSAAALQQPPAGLPGMPPQGQSVAASTSAAGAPVRTGPARTPISGIVLMPTAYRGSGAYNTVGLGLDINAAYYIGRLYGKNNYSWTVDKKNYLDRIGIWLLSADTKMQVQSEGDWRPAMAAGVQGIFKFTDGAQPQANSTVNLTVKASGKTTNSYANAYLAVSKKLGRKFLVNAGYSDGDMPKVIYTLSEFLSQSAINLSNGHATTDPVNIPTGMLFGGLMWFPKPNSPIALEVMVPQGAPQSPKLFNLHLGTLLKLNFEISYLSFKGGWDAMGMFQFRYNYMPK
jgi:hypothetical protein